ncbi:MAG: hypothetical protein CMB73_08420 [Euryarchaeota archaeon]|nr:hypothetical protein [Euryarchaeota archaeon]|tara:strand:+ start:43043 stop:48505 length:5463 start_codon:yes stop_codon:yes gene_type:complete
MARSVSSARGILLIVLFLFLATPFTPLVDNIAPNAEASGVARHVYEFSNGNDEYIALYQGANPDVGSSISIPKGAKVTDVSMTLSGASSTGWSDIVDNNRDDWIEGEISSTDSRSDDLTLAMANMTVDFFPHGNSAVEDSSSTAWLDNGSYAIRQPHTSNATENRFSQQLLKSSNSLTANSQGAMLKHHDWLFMSTWSSSNFNNIVQRMYTNNITRESTIHLDQNGCQLPQKHSSSYYGMWGFRDWALSDDERLFAILSGYKYTYSSSAPTTYHRVLEFDVSRDDVWTCMDSYDVSPQFGEYTAIAYDASDDTFWIVHNAQRRVVNYDFEGNGQFTRSQQMYSYSSTGGSVYECGKTNQQVRGLEMRDSTFYMRCQEGSVYNDKDQLEAWSISGSSTSLVPQTGTRDLSSLGYGLQYDGKRFITVDSGYSTWSSSTLYYREYGTGWTYQTTPAPGTTEWFGPVTKTGDDVLSVNMKTYSSAQSIGDRVDYWVSADNGTHWVPVESNSTIHFDYPGKELVWKAKLIGSTAVSWWVELEYSTEYEASGSWVSPHKQTGTKVGKVRPVWVADVPAGTDVNVMVSNNNGTTWEDASNGQELSFPGDDAGQILKYAVFLSTTDSFLTPKVSEFTLFYEEGYPDRPQIDVGDDNIWDWRSILFLNESAVQVSDESEVGVDVSAAPSLVQAFNDFIPENGEGTVNVPIAVKAASPGRVKISNIDISYTMQTRAIDASLEGGILSPDGIYRNLKVNVAHGDNVNRVSKAIIQLNNTNGVNPSFQWLNGDICSVNSDGGGLVNFDVNNCTSTEGLDGRLSITVPLEVNWDWDDEPSTEALITVEDPLGVQVTAWETENFGLKVENDIQLDALQVTSEDGRSLYNGDFVRGGKNLSFTGQIHFQDSSLSPLAGQFDLRILGQNVTFDGDPIREPVILAQEANPGFGAYNITFQSPIESEPGGMVFYVEAVNLPNGSTFSNPGYNSIKFILDGNSPLVIDATPMDMQEKHASSPGSGQPVSIKIQDSVEPPNQITMNYWIGCKASENMGCHDYNFDGLPQADEYEILTFSSPEILPGGLNIFEGVIDDSMLRHGKKVSFFVTGQDSKGNEIAMGGSPVCPAQSSGTACGFRPGEVAPDWDADLVTYIIREEFEPVIDATNSTILGHDDRKPLHPGIQYVAQISLSDGNGWEDINYIQYALGGSFDDDDTSIFISLEEGLDGEPVAVMESGGDGLAVSNLYSSVITSEDNDSIIVIRAQFQLTWTFSESFDTNGETFFIPKMRVTDLPCREGETTPCNQVEAGMGNDYWSLDNDFRFDAQPGKIRAIELRDGTNHYNEENQESIIGAGQALRVTGRVLFSEDETPAPAGAFDVAFGDYDNSWTTSPRDDGEFSLDLLVPSVRSGYLDLGLTLQDLPGLAEDESPRTPRVRLAVDSENPTIGSINLGGISPDGDISIGEAHDLLIQLETNDDHGFDKFDPASLHYRVRAGEAEISRGSVTLPDTTPFGEQFFWTGNLDLTDGGATTLLPSYFVDVWVSGSDAAGNPYVTQGNSLLEPVATWKLALLGPSFDIFSESSMVKWDKPTPVAGEEVTLTVSVENEGGRGNVSFVLQRFENGGYWADIDRVDIQANAGAVLQATLTEEASTIVSSSTDYRLLALIDNVELDRRNLEPLIVKEETKRGSEAFTQDVSDQKLSVIMYIVAIVSLSAMMWMLIIYRRMQAEDEIAEDQTSIVKQEMDGKALPEIKTPVINQAQTPLPAPPGLVVPPGVTLPAPQVTAPTPAPAPAPAPQVQDVKDSDDPRGNPPLPPTGLPEGWTAEQWNHYGWKYLDSQN